MAWLVRIVDQIDSYSHDLAGIKSFECLDIFITILADEISK